MGLPSALIAPLRAALSSQGFPDSSISDNGDISPLALLSGVYQTLEIRTGISPPVKVDLVQIGQPNSAPPGAFTKFLQPTLILATTGDNPTRAVLAPFGEASPYQGVVIALCIVGGIFAAGYLTGTSRK